MSAETRHEITIHDEATGRSTCSCCQWTYLVRNFRPQWPMESKAVADQVNAAFARHLAFAKTQEKSETKLAAVGR